MALFSGSDSNIRTRFYAVIAAAVTVGVLAVAPVSAHLFGWPAATSQAQCEQRYGCFQGRGGQFTKLSYKNQFHPPCACWHNTTGLWFPLIQRIYERAIQSLEGCALCDFGNHCFRCTDGDRAVRGKCPAPKTTTVTAKPTTTTTATAEPTTTMTTTAEPTTTALAPPADSPAGSLAVRNQLYLCPSGPGYSEMVYDPSTMTH